MQTNTLKKCKEACAIRHHPSILLWGYIIRSIKTLTSSCLGMRNLVIFDLVLAESDLLEGTPRYDLVVSAGNFSFGDSSGAWS